MTGRRSRPASAQASSGPATSSPRRAAFPPIAVGTMIASVDPSAYSTAPARSAFSLRGSTIRAAAHASGIVTYEVNGNGA